MATRILHTEQDRQTAQQWLAAHALPCTLSIKKGKDRTPEQNRLQRMWMNEAAEQLGEDTPEGYRAYCKLHFGVPILREEHEEFCAAYDRIIKPHSYEEKLAMMALPLDFPVTRLMTTKEKSRYLDAVWAHFTGLGVQLTDPEGKFG